MIRNNIWILGVLLGVSLSVKGQDSILVDNSVRFEDGPYQSFAALKNNTPDISWQDLRVELYVNPQNGFVRVLEASSDQYAKAADEWWGFTWQGIPYIRLRGNPSIFVPIKVRGRLMHYAFTEKVSKPVVIEAYNPLTGRAFRKGTVEQTEVVERHYILHWEDGKSYDFDKSNLEVLIDNDQVMRNTVRQISPEDPFEKLIKCLKIYDDRNPVYIIK